MGPHWWYSWERSPRFFWAKLQRGVLLGAGKNKQHEGEGEKSMANNLWPVCASFHLYHVGLAFLPSGWDRKLLCRAPADVFGYGSQSGSWITERSSTTWPGERLVRNTLTYLPPEKMSCQDTLEVTCARKTAFLLLVIQNHPSCWGHGTKIHKQKQTSES